MRGRWLLAGAATMSMLGALGGLPALMVLGSAAAPSDSAGYTCSTPPPAAPAALTGPTGDVSAPVPGHGTVTLDAEQSGYAKTIIDTGRNLKVPERGWVVAIATALQESTLQNLTWGDRDSIGLFQQRDAWGSRSQRLDPAQSAEMFYTGGHAGQRGLLDIAGWQVMSVAGAAQAVQVSAFPSAYARWETLATRAVSAISGGVAPAPVVTCEPAPAEDEPATPGEFPLTNLAAIDRASNGQIPVSLLPSVPWAKGHHLRPDALNDLVPLNAAYRERFGRDICMTDSYRTLAQQQRLYVVKPGLAAVPGTSNHGLARALDLCDGIQNFDSPEHIWLAAHGPRYGWRNPSWAVRGGSRPEPWHFSWRTDN